MLTKAGWCCRGCGRMPDEKKWRCVRTVYAGSLLHPVSAP